MSGTKVGKGWVYFNPDSGEEYSDQHPTKSGEVPDATDIRRSTLQEDHLWAMWQAAESALTTSRAEVERLREALEHAEAELFEAEDKFWVAHCNFPVTVKESFAQERQQQDKDFLAKMSDRMKAARLAAARARSTGEAV